MAGRPRRGPANCRQDRRIRLEDGLSRRCVERKVNGDQPRKSDPPTGPDDCPYPLYRETRNVGVFSMTRFIPWTAYSSASTDCRQDQRIVHIDNVEKQEALNDQPQKITATHHFSSRRHWGNQ
ncbi:uncharacterized protein LOC101862474 [Aplysia californica]|uniref:Uncharacterized protein LOC101862474 n=1 Tax=Aplysia californica TaxID=6500 RepID=A0ABM0KAF5_APLCA|nr:uncharacterized protein LOC101862474 [Aplysia californica]